MRRKIVLFLLITFAFVLSLNCQMKTTDENVKACKYLSFAEAEKILGRQVELVTNSWTFTKDITKSDCKYRAIENDKTSGQTINLFFMLEENSDETEAKQIYANIWDSNKNHQGIEILSGLGDEAYAHSDKSNFHFVFVRKGKFTIRMKVNKAVETTSLEELKAFAKKVIEQI